MKRSTSFLIVRLGSLGDVIHAVPAALALRSAFPDAQIDWVTDPRYVELLGMVPAVNRRIPIDTRALLTGGEASVLTAIGQLRRSRYDVAIDLQGLLKSAALARAAGARRTVGFPREHLRESAARFFYTETPDPGLAPHVVHRNLSIVRSLGAAGSEPMFGLNVPASSEVDPVVATYRASGFALLNPGAAWPNKRWPARRFGAVADALRRTYGWPSLVLWGPGEEGLATAVVATSGGAAKASPRTTIPELAALTTAARVMISGDTGPLHIAAATGTPVVALFGPTRAERNGPWHPADIVIARTSKCGCLYRRQCRMAQRCIDDITVDEVVAAVARRMATRG